MIILIIGPNRNLTNEVFTRQNQASAWPHKSLTIIERELLSLIKKNIIKGNKMKIIIKLGLFLLSPYLIFVYWRNSTKEHEEINIEFNH
jgi:hypothetical protein